MNYPISLWVEKKEEKEVTDDEAEDEVVEEVDEDGKVEEAEDEKEKKKKTKKVTEVSYNWDELNTQKPIWCRKPETVTEDEYQSFYKNLTNDWSNALTYKHFHAEGQLEFDCLLYLPERAPMDMFNQTIPNTIKLSEVV